MIDAEVAQRIASALPIQPGSSEPPAQGCSEGPQSQTQMLLKQLQQVMAAVQASPLPEGIDAQVVSELSFPEVSTSLSD